MPKTNPAKLAPEWAARLTHRERTFVEYYVISLNATQSALASGYGKGTNANVAARQGHLLRAKPHVAEAIAALVAERAGVTGAHVLAKLGAIINTDVSEVAIVKNGVVTVKDTAELSPDALVSVAGYETNEKGFVTVRQYDKIAALNLLAKILGMRRSPTDAPGVQVNVAIQNTTANDDLMKRIDAMVRRQPALPAPTEQPMQLPSPITIEEPVYVE